MIESSTSQAASEERFQQYVKEVVLRLLGRNAQPAAWELLEHVEREAGFKACWELETVLKELVNDPDQTRMLRAYVDSLLKSGDLSQALRDEEPPRSQVWSSIDELLRVSALYRSTQKFQEMISFMARFKDYSPYNNMLVHMQNPSCGYYATQKDWYRRFQRTLKEDARPMLILAPMHPVLMVYDLDQTVGPSLPKHLEEFAHFKGAWNPAWLERAVENAENHYHIRVDFKTLSTTHAGFAINGVYFGDSKMRIAIHDGLDEPSRFGVLCHELAHILSGHLGCDQDHWWPSRMGLGLHTIEIEAEAAAYIVTSRLGLEGASASYVSGHMKGGQLPKSVSLDTIAKVSGRIERMAKKKLDRRKSQFSMPVL